MRATATTGVDGGPFDRPGLGRKVLPFAAVAVLAEASLALPPGPASAGYTVLSLVLLVATAGAMFLPWPRLPAWTTVAVPLVYVGSVLTLILAAGGSTSGVGIVILIPLLWTALFHHRWESFVVVGAIVAIEIVTSLTPVKVPDAVLLRRIVFWSAMGVLISVATHDLRSRLSRTILQREASLRQTGALEAAAEELTSILDPDQVVVTATRLAAHLVSPPGTPGRRAQYTRVTGTTVTMVAQYDEVGGTVVPDFPLADHPNLTEVMQTGRAVRRPIVASAAGASLREVITSLGVSNGVYVPVFYGEVIDGVLSVPVRGLEVSDELFECCKAIGHLTELALGNARTHALLEALATSDPLTGLANRRAFDEAIAGRPGRSRFSVLALDVDGLKGVNDTHGHDAGDSLLVHIATVLSGVLRQGDVLARTGGDEFAVYLFDADVDQATRAAERMLGALSASPFLGMTPGVSIGVADGRPHEGGREVVTRADAAMYRAKREGGHGFRVAERHPVRADLPEGTRR